MDKIVVKNQIIEYMHKHCCGAKNAKPRHMICDDLVLDDRIFRQICVELKEEGHIATTSSDGYFFVPLVTFDKLPQEDIDAIHHSINSMRSRAKKLWDTADKMAHGLGEKVNRQEAFV